MNRTGSLVVQDAKGRDRERYPIVYGARLKVRDGAPVEPGQILVEWDPYTFSILTEDAGTVKYKDLISDVTFHEEVDEVTGLSRKIVVDSPDEKKQPLIEIRDKAGKVVRKYHMPSHAHLMIEDGDAVYAGQVLAKIPRETTKTKDITGGLPRVVELFEARKPRETAVISEIDGIVKHGGIVKGLRKIIIVPEEGGEPREYSLPRGVHVNVQEGDRVRAGEPLMDGPSNPHDILSVLGEKALHCLPRQRNPGGLPAAGRQHQRQAHRGHRPADDAVGEDRGCRRHRVPDRGAGRPLPVHGRERARDCRPAGVRRRAGRCCSASPRRRSRPTRSSRRRRSRRRRACSPRRRFQARSITCAA